MDGYTSDEVREALRPIASLISKSEKAQHKLAPGTWQHTMLRDNLSALRIASALMEGDPGVTDAASCDDLQAAVGALAVMIDRVGNTEAKFAPGTSQHSLQRNRLSALCIAREAVEAELARR